MTKYTFFLGAMALGELMEAPITWLQSQDSNKCKLCVFSYLCYTLLRA